MKTAFLFPGQGAQYVGMGKDFYDSFPVAKKIFDEADEILGEKLSKVIFEGPKEALTETKTAQLAIFVTSIAVLRVLQEQKPDLKPQYIAGLSLGEYTALCASGRLDFKQTLLLVRERARLMNEACERSGGTMAAVLGLDSKTIKNVLKDLDGVWVANFNAPGQTVISGTVEGVEKGGAALKENGAKRVIPLSVHGAFHSPLMQTAQDGLALFVQKVQLNPSEINFAMNVPGGFVQGNEAIKENLISQVTHSVSWEQEIEAMKKAGVEFFVEIGCGKTLAGLNKKMGITSMVSVDKVTDLEFSHATT